MGARWCADDGMLYSLASCWVVSLAGWEKGQGACARCGVGGQWCGACCWVPGPPGPLSGVVFRSRRPGRAPCGVDAWGGVVWWFENWRVDASMNGVPFGVCRVCSYC